MSDNVWIDLGFLVAAVCFILALKGLSSPRHARLGNLLGAFGAVLAVVLIFVSERSGNTPFIVIAILVGAVVGIGAARRVAMTAMPQLVALFNGVGGGAAALVALLELAQTGGLGPAPVAAADGEYAQIITVVTYREGFSPLMWDVKGNLLAIAFTVLIGAISFSGSAITFAKLQELMTSRPIVPPGAQWLFGGAIIAALALSVLVVTTGNTLIGVVLALVALGLGVLLVLPVGGADVPIVISLLNAFTGLSVAASGYLLGNTLLLVAGTLVGAAGALLTKLMAQAMGRSVANIMFGALRGGSTLGASVESQRPVKSAPAEDIAVLLGYAQRVIVVPGYGLAVAQAQHTLRELADILHERGIEVTYAIHPVAGRMPGHMNVLLAEANVPYEQLVEMDQINPEFKSADVALVVGANDVVNPAARSPQGSPISGMPILDADHANAVVFMKRSMRPGFAGIENELLYDPRTTLLFGDAKASLTKLVSAVKAL